jgi:hypothetical protein
LNNRKNLRFFPVDIFIPGDVEIAVILFMIGEHVDAVGFLKK